MCEHIDLIEVWEEVKVQTEFDNDGESIQNIMESIVNNYLIKNKTCNLSDTELECTNKM